MTAARAGWLALALLLLVPYVVLFAAGTVWLYQRHWLWIWFVLAAVITAVAAWLLGRLRRQALARADLQAAPANHWPPAGDDAWRAVDSIAERVQAEDLPLDRFEPWRGVLMEVLGVVARTFHPRSERPEWETSAPHVMRIIELVARDLRLSISEYVPGSHLLTLHDFRRLSRGLVKYQHLYLLYRIVTAPINPVATLLRELRDGLAGREVNRSLADLKRHFVGYAVRRAGYHAIQLYSGHLELEGVGKQGYRPRRSAAEEQAARDDGVRLDEEPLRILVAGQVKAGKSSLVNALFGEVRAAVDVLPRTRYSTPYVLERDGLPRAILLDTAGYEDATWSRQAADELARQALEIGCDLILLVASATVAARGPDRRVLDVLRTAFQADRRRIMPPVVAVLTHIDLLRPVRQWNPPYDLQAAADEKSREIAAAGRAVAEDFGLPAADVVPVCLTDDRLYNVDALAAAMLLKLPEARRALCIRCLRQRNTEEAWSRLTSQLINAGRLLLHKGQELLLG